MTSPYPPKNQDAGKRDTPMCFKEPELSEVPNADKPIVRNVLYTAWALQENSAGPSVGWEV